MPKPATRPRILIITPEAAFVPAGLVNRRHCQRVLQGGFVAFLSDLINALCERGVNVHVAQPDYRRMFADLAGNKNSLAESNLPAHRLHLAEDRVFFYSNPLDTNGDWENTNIALNFQREISHQILPRVQPDLIHCHDWMTGLIPAVAKKQGIPCLFSAVNFHSSGSLLARIEDRGIDAAAIWQYLYYERYPGNYEETRNSNPLDFLLSAILSACHVNTASTGRLAEAAEHRRDGFHGRLMQLLQQKLQAGCASELPLFGIPSDDYNRRRHSQVYGNHPAGGRSGHLPSSSRMDRRAHPVFNPQGAVQCICELYEKLLQQPLVSPAPISAVEIKKNDRQKTANGLTLQEKKVRGVNSHAPFGRRRASPATAS
jgi:starch synthase